jgi:hypothetical protein
MLGKEQRSLTIVALIFFGALFAETMLEPGPLWATSGICLPTSVQASVWGSDVGSLRKLQRGARYCGFD